MREAVVFAQTIDEDETGLSYVTFQDGYGFPAYVPSEQAISYGVLVLNGASPVLDHLTFSGSNTSDVLAYNQAAPVISDSTFANGDDAREYGGSAILAFNAGGSASRPFVIRDSDLTGIPVDDCGQNGGGKGTILPRTVSSKDNLDISNSATASSSARPQDPFAPTIDVGRMIDTNGRKEIGTTVFAEHRRQRHHDREWCSDHRIRSRHHRCKAQRHRGCRPRFWNRRPQCCGDPDGQHHRADRWIQRTVDPRRVRCHR